MIVDDNKQNVTLLTDILESQGYYIESASSGAGGIELAHKSNPNLILMDVQMPGMSGTEAMKLLKADNTLHKVPVIAVTALAMIDDKNELMLAGFDGYLSKPISFVTLLKTVEKFLSEFR